MFYIPVALDKVRAEYIKEKAAQINDNSSQDGDNGIVFEHLCTVWSAIILDHILDNSDWMTEDDETKKTGTKKKTLKSQKNLSKDQLINTIYNGMDV